MRPLHRPGLRRWGLVPAAVLVLATLATGCSSSKPAYCTDASQLKTSVDNLGNVNVAQNGLSSLKTALSKVETNAKTFTADAKSAFPSQTTALKNSLSSLETAITSAQDQPSVAAAAAVVPSVTQVKTAASNLQNAVKGKCQ
jgi:hypothetical protein